MRFSFVVSRWLGYPISGLFETPESFAEFRNALDLLKENGFDGVELNLHFSDDSLLTRIQNSIQESGLKLAAVGTGLLYAVEHLSFTDPESSRRARAVDVVKDLVRFASQSDAVVILGLLRGSCALTQDSVRRMLERCLVECDSAAERCGGRLAIEAINRYETQSLNNAAEVASMIDSLKLKATGILLDTFHMNIEEQSIESTLSKHISKLEHFHIADSNRWPPGDGHLDVGALLTQLNDLDYMGWASAETLPKPTRDDAVKHTAAYLKGLDMVRTKSKGL